LRRIFLLAVLSLSPFSAKAGDFNLDGLNAAAVRAVPETSVAIPRVSGPKAWTVMLYSTTKDKLRYTLVWQLLEMKKTGSTGLVNVAVEASFPVKYADGTISTPTFRMALGNAVNADELDKLIEAMFRAGERPIDFSLLAPFGPDIVKTENGVDTGDWRRAAEFTKWAKTNYPARRYAFVIYGHGNGIFDPQKNGRGTLIDAETKNYVSIPELGLLMKETGHVDAFVMLSCIMQMAEVAYEIKDYADVVVGSSELMWSVGYDLNSMLASLNSNPDIPGEKLGGELSDGYIQRVKEFKLSGAHSSVIITSRFPAFVGKLNAWVEAELALNDHTAAVNAVKNAARFDIFGVTLSSSPALARRLSISGDLYDFVSLVTANTPRDTSAQLLARQRGAELMDFIAGGLVYKYVYTGKTNTGFDFSRAHGLSIYVPPVSMPFGSLVEFENHLQTLYRDLPFARETRWPEFVNWLYPALFPKEVKNGVSGGI